MARVLVTGIGIVSPLGRGARRNMRRLLAGDCAIAPLTLFELDGARASLAGQTDVHPAEIAPAGAAAGFSRADAMAVLAAREALAEAKLEPARAPTALFVGGTTAGMYECEAELARLARTPTEVVDRTSVRSKPLTAPADRVHELLGPFGSVRSVCSACSGGAVAIWLAASAIRAGRLSRALAGGVDALSRLTFAGFSALGALDRTACRPFDVTRAGLTLGEAAAFLVLESEAAAAERGAEAICELAGWAGASEAHHITHPEPDGATAARVMRAALDRAGVGAEDIDYVNAHGTGTPLNDQMEAAAIRTCLGEHADRVAVSSVKGAIGHALGAAGAVEAAITALAVASGAMPRTTGLEEPDPRCDVRHLLASEERRVRAAISNAFGFGGTDVSLVFAERGVARPPRNANRTRAVITGGAVIAPRTAGTSAAARALLDGAPLTADEPADLPADGLDPMRARRMERVARLFTTAAEMAIREANDAHHARDAAVVAGSAWGSPDATSAFLARLFEKGARFASPAGFPGALPSSLASNASIYLGLRGVAFTTTDLGASAESAFATAVDLVEDGEVTAVVCGGVEEKNEIARRVSTPLCAGIEDGGRRSEGSGVLVIESRERARARGRAPLAEIAAMRTWRGQPELDAIVPPPTEGAALVVAARDSAEIPRAWRERPRHVVARRAGEHESVGGLAMCAAVSAVVAKQADEVLVVGGAPDRGYAFIVRSLREEDAT